MIVALDAFVTEVDHVVAVEPTVALASDTDARVAVMAIANPSEIFERVRKPLRTLICPLD